jgi:hypothetical protein
MDAGHRENVIGGLEFLAIPIAAFIAMAWWLLRRRNS